MSPPLPGPIPVTTLVTGSRRCQTAPKPPGPHPGAALGSQRVGERTGGTDMSIFKALAVKDVDKATRANFNESFFISHDRSADHPDVVAGTPLRGKNQWPERHERMRAAMVAYFKTLEGLGERLLPVLARSLAMPADHFGQFFRNEAHINLRFLHYPPQETHDAEQFGQGPHTDNSFITMLAREDVPGLAVRLPSGEWMAPPVIAGTFLVNLGNIMKRWSNDRFLSTPHGVLNDSGKDRYSIAFFYSPNVDSVIECLPSCAGDPPRYPRAVYRDLVLEFYNANYFHRKDYAGAAAGS